MGVDQQGYIWLSDPWIATVTIVMAVLLLIWCHRALGTDGSEGAVAVPVRSRRTPPARRLIVTAVPNTGHQAAFERELRDVNRRCVA